MNVLFVCKHNRFRSKVAEALFKKYNKRDSVKSAGVKMDLPYVAPLVKKSLMEYGINDVDDVPHIIDNETIGWADRIMIVADNVDLSLFPDNKIEVWPIQDCDQNDEEGIRMRIVDIDRRVRDYITSMNILQN